MLRLALIVAATLAVAGALFGAGWRAGQDRAEASHRAREELIRDTADAVEARTAERIAGIRVVHQTINGQVREVVRENTVYRDCVVDESTRRLLDAARRGELEPGAGGGRLPAAGTSAAP